MEPDGRDGVVPVLDYSAGIDEAMNNVKSGQAGDGLHDIVFALNLASAFAYGLLVSVLTRMTEVPPDDLAYFFLRGAARINRVLLLSPVSPVSTSDMERHFPGLWEQPGRELVLLVSVFGATAMVYLLLRSIAGTRLHWLITTCLLGPSLLFAAPLSYLWAMHGASRNVPFLEFSPAWGASHWSLGLVLAAEGLAAIVVLLATRTRAVPDWLLGACGVLHFGFWIPVLWSALPDWATWGDFASYFGFVVPRRLLIGWLVLAVIWARWLRRGQPAMPEAGARAMAWTPLIVVTAVAMCAFVWLPQPVRSAAHPSHRESMTIEVSRGPCYGLCPRYSVRVHGNGSVEYTGDLHGARGQATATIGPGQVTAILAELDRAGFFAIEDSAFRWCFDTPGIAVLVSMDGVTHRVSSDASSSCTGAPTGTQARFLQAANEIDRIIGSRRWTE